MIFPNRNMETFLSSLLLLFLFLYSGVSRCMDRPQLTEPAPSWWTRVASALQLLQCAERCDTCAVSYVQSGAALRYPMWENKMQDGRCYDLHKKEGKWNVSLYLLHCHGDTLEG